MSRSTGIASWEETDFPSVCETCLGSNPYLRMTKEALAHDCKVCLKPFTNFRWCPGPKMRFRQTEICATCAKLKNICQSCMLDLKYGLPVQVRDSVLGIKESVPKNEANREFFIAANKARLSRGDTSFLEYDKTSPEDRELLSKISRKTPNYQRNLAPACSFYAKGKCTRGETCPYRHELVAERYPSLQSYRDRYYGENDPAAQKIYESHPELKQKELEKSKPSSNDKASLFVQGIRSGIKSSDLEEYFSPMAPVSSVKMVADGTAAIVKFNSNEEADSVATKVLGDANICNVNVTISWAKSSLKKRRTE